MKPAERPHEAKPSNSDSLATCRVCGGIIKGDGSTAPFCSDRCRMADLGKWLSGEYRISREIKDADLDTNE